MASTVQAWISAARLRTLPLSVAGIITGTAVAYADGFFKTPVFVLALFTTVAFQVLSNLANDYGDGVKGTDNADRIGPARALQSGTISREALKKGILLNAAIAFLLALSLVYLAFGFENLLWPLIFLGLGILAIWAAVYYTVGRRAYGYQGLGDVFVFLFFGLLAVMGSYFLYAQNVNTLVWLPASAIGLLSAGVLNLNNMRDRISDAISSKNTLAVRLGSTGSKVYHTFLLTIAFTACLIFALQNHFTGLQYLFLLPFLLLLKHVIFVWKNKTPALLDPELKKLALSTFALSVFLWLAILL